MPLQPGVMKVSDQSKELRVHPGLYRGHFVGASPEVLRPEHCYEEMRHTEQATSQYSEPVV